jgi:hypothetical protein
MLAGATWRRSGAVAILAARALACSLDLPDEGEYTRTPAGAFPDAATPNAIDGSALDGPPGTLPPVDGRAPEGSVTPVSDAGSLTTCGGNGIEGDPNTLYRKDSSGIIQTVEVCAKGCEWAPRPKPDTCRSDATCEHGIGLYCGGNGISGDPDVLFRCSAGQITVEQRCPDGCIAKQPNVNDECVWN